MTQLSSSPSAAAPAVARLAVEAGTARELTSDPVWHAAEYAPWIGPQLKALATVAGASNELLKEGLLPLATAAIDVPANALEPAAGHIDTSFFSTVSVPAHDAAIHAAAASRDVSNIDRRPLLGVVNAAVAETETRFGEIASALDGFSRAAQLVPEMLGGNGPRNYLLIVQNNAEWRSLGGITGTAILMHAEQGTLSLVSTQSATELSRSIRTPVVELPDEAVEIYETRPARYFHNLTQIPDFTIDGPMAREMYRVATGTSVDGVIAVDPVVLSYMLKATGPVTLPTGDQLGADAVVPFLLNGVYERYEDPAQQDAVFASVAGTTFRALLDGRASVSGLLSALIRAGVEHRLLIWSADEGEQELLRGTTLAGELPTSDDTTARFGVYLNDATGSKMSYFVSPTASLTWGNCSIFDPNVRRQLTISLTLTSDAPVDAATALPGYITGGGSFGTPPGDVRIVGNIYVPSGFDVVSAEDSSGGSFSRALFQGREVLTFGSDLRPGESATVSVTVSATTSATEAQAFVTPTADAGLSPVVTEACGGQ